MLHHYEEAVAVYRRWENPPLHMYILLALNYAQLGRMDAAAEAMARFADRRPESVDFALYAATHVRVCKRQEDREHWLEGYRKVCFGV